MTSEDVRVAILTISDRAFTGVYEDTCGEALAERINAMDGMALGARALVGDDVEAIASQLRQLAQQHDAVYTTGGTGIGPRDVTPEATRTVIQRELPGIAEMMRAAGMQQTPFAALSRQCVGQAGQCLIINLPGSRNGAVQGVELTAGLLSHARSQMQGQPH